MDFYIVDVFTYQERGGSPLGVFICEKWPSEQSMFGIARELGFQEVTFLRKIEETGKLEMRIFTINYELPFAGHPTLGTAWVARRVFNIDADQVTLECKMGDIPVEFSDSSDSAILTMKQQQPTLGIIFTPKEITNFTNLEPEDIDLNFPIQHVSIGANFMIIPLVSELTLSKVTINYEQWLEFLKINRLHMSTSSSGLTTSLYFYAPIASQKDQYHARMFSDQHNMPDEDAATGSAAGCLLAYLLKYKEMNSLKATIKQGESVGRPSELYIDGAYDGKRFDLWVGGRVKYVAKGEWTTNV